MLLLSRASVHEGVRDRLRRSQAGAGVDRSAWIIAISIFECRVRKPSDAKLGDAGAAARDSSVAAAPVGMGGIEGAALPGSDCGRGGWPELYDLGHERRKIVGNLLRKIRQVNMTAETSKPGKRWL